MSKTVGHPFLTFVASGIAAFVLIGGAFASIQAVSQNQDNSTQAYMGKAVRTPSTNMPLLCGKTCRVDSECGSGGYCLAPVKPTCPPGKRCAEILTVGTCRAAACSGDTECSCATNAVKTSGLAVPMR